MDRNQLRGRLRRVPSRTSNPTRTTIRQATIEVGEQPPPLSIIAAGVDEAACLSAPHPCVGEPA